MLTKVLVMGERDFQINYTPWSQFNVNLWNMFQFWSDCNKLWTNLICLLLIRYVFVVWALFVRLFWWREVFLFIYEFCFCFCFCFGLARFSNGLFPLFTHEKCVKEVMHCCQILLFYRNDSLFSFFFFFVCVLFVGFTNVCLQTNIH